MVRGLVALALVGGLAACRDGGGDDADGPATTEEAETTTTTAATLQPCPAVSTEAVAEAFGLAVELVEGGDDACDFMLGDAATLLVSGEGSDAASCEAGSEVEGEGGWACVVDGVPTAQVVVDEHAVTLTVTGEVAVEASRDALVRLLPRVTPAG